MKRLLLFLFVIFPLLSMAHDFEKDGIYYSFTKGYTVGVAPAGDSYISNEYSGDVTIPESVFYNDKEYKVTSIYYSAFRGCSGLTSITIPNSVTRIYDAAFKDCSGLTSVSFSNSVTSIGDYAFYGCSVLTSITIPTSVTSIGKYAFERCTGKLYVNCNIPDGAFYGAWFEMVEIGNDVTSIGDYAFSDCSVLTSMTIGNSVTSIGKCAFEGCTGKLYVNSIPSSNYKGSFYGSKFTEVEIGSDVQSIGDYAFRNCLYLKSVNIPTSVTSIGKYAFERCPGKLYVNCNIPNGAFYGAWFKMVEIGNDVTSIGDYAFFNCSNLTNVSIPECVENIGKSAFFGCTNLVSTTIPDKVTSIGDSTFYGCSALTTIKIPDIVTSIGEKAFYKCSSLTELTIPNSVTTIGESAFYECSNLISMDIPNSVNGIGDYAFWGCTGKLHINCNIPDSKYDSHSYNYIGPFNGSAFQEVIFGSDITSIGSAAFYGCTTLESALIPENVKNIEYRTFYGCSNLRSAVILNSVTNIGSEAFYGCSSLKEIVISNNVTSIGSAAFSKCGGNLYLNCNIPDEYKSTNGIFNGSSFRKVEIGSLVTSIGKQAFYNSSITSLTLGANITSIGEDAFTDRPVKTIWMTNTLPTGYSCAEGTINYASNNSKLRNLQVYPYLSSMFEVDGIKYVPISPSDRTCDAIDCSYESNDSIINIEKTVSYKNIEMSIKNINSYIARNNKYIKKVNINADCSIGESAFSGCYAMESIQLGNSIKSIGSSAFYRCVKLEEISIPNATTTIGDECFSGCSSLANVNLGCGLTEIPYETFYECSSLTEIKIPSNVATIGNFAFRDCSSLSNLIIEDRKTELSLGANTFVDNPVPLFKDCPLDSVYIGGNIRYNTSKDYGYSPFYRNTSLRTVVVTDEVDNIYNNEFYGCTNLQNVTIGDGVKKIGNYAFSGCSSLKGFAFGTGLQSIGKEAFSDCTAMTKISSEAKVPPTCGTQALDDLNKWECALYVPKASIDAYKAADQWKDFLFIDVNTNAKASYKLIYLVEGETYSESEVDEGATITPLEAPTKEGYTFSGWSEVPETMPAHDVTITGTFTVNKYKLTYMVDGELYKESEVAYGDSITVLEAPTKEGYTFSGWSEVPKTMPAHDVTITGTFTVNKYKLTYMVDGELYKESEVAYGDSVKVLEAPTKEGYTFSGWSEVPETMPAHDVTITGTFTVNKYKLTYMVDGVLYKESEIEYGATITPLDIPTKEGYTFSGWSEIPEIMPAHDVIVIGTFKFNPAAAVNPVVEDNSEITEHNAEDITEFKMNVTSGATFAVNDGAKVELWIGGVLKGTAEKKDISEKDGVVTVKFTPVSANAGARGMLGEFWNTVATSSSEDVEILVKVAANSFKINNEDITEELSYTYTAKASVAEKIENEVTALDEINAGGVKDIIYNLNGSRINGNAPKGIIIKNGKKVLVK